MVYYRSTAVAALVASGLVGLAPVTAFAAPATPAESPVVSQCATCKVLGQVDKAVAKTLETAKEMYAQKQTALQQAQTAEETAAAQLETKVAAVTEKTADKAAKRSAAIAAWEALRSQAQAAADKADAELAAEQAKIDAAKATQKKAADELADAQAQLTAAQEALDAAKKAAAEDPAAPAPSAEEIAAAQKLADDAAAKVSAVTKEIADAQTKLDEATAQKAAADKALIEAQTAKRAADEQLEAANDQLQQAQEEKTDADARLKEAEQAAAAAEAEKQQQIAAAQQEIERAQTAVNEATAMEQQRAGEAEAAAKALTDAQAEAKRTAEAASSANQELQAAETKLAALKETAASAKQAHEDARVKQQKATSDFNEALLREQQARDEVARIEGEIADAQAGQKSLEELQAEVNFRKRDLEESKERAQKQWAKGSLGFFEVNESDAAIDVLTSDIHTARDGSKVLAATNLGAEGDATSLDLMKHSIDQLDLINAKRETEHGIRGRGLSTLKVDDYSMAVAQTSANWARNKTAHPQAFNAVNENLAWGPSKTADEALAGWWDAEKQAFEQLRDDLSLDKSYDFWGRQIEKDGVVDRNEIEAYLKDHPVSVQVGGVTRKVTAVGHYLNLVDDLMYNVPAGSGNVMIPAYEAISAGYAVREADTKAVLGGNFTSYVQALEIYADYGVNQALNVGEKLSVADYRAKFEAYYNTVKEAKELGSVEAREQLKKAEEAYEAAKAAENGEESPELKAARATLEKAIQATKEADQVAHDATRTKSEMRNKQAAADLAVNDQSSEVARLSDAAEEAQQKAEEAGKAVAPLAQKSQLAAGVLDAAKRNVANAQKALKQAREQLSAITGGGEALDGLRAAAEKAQTALAQAQNAKAQAEKRVAGAAQRVAGDEKAAQAGATKLGEAQGVKAEADAKLAPAQGEAKDTAAKLAALKDAAAKAEASKAKLAELEKKVAQAKQAVADAERAVAAAPSAEDIKKLEADFEAKMPALAQPGIDNAEALKVPHLDPWVAKQIEMKAESLMARAFSVADPAVVLAPSPAIKAQVAHVYELYRAYLAADEALKMAQAEQVKAQEAYDAAHAAVLTAQTDLEQARVALDAAQKKYDTPLALEVPKPQVKQGSGEAKAGDGAKSGTEAKAGSLAATGSDTSAAGLAVLFGGAGLVLVGLSRGARRHGKHHA